MNSFRFEAQPPSSQDDRGVVVPAGISSKAELFTFLSKAIPLPNYFGHNWDALEECLGDLDWLSRPKLVLIHQDIPLENQRHDQKIYLQILAKAAQNSDRFEVIFPENSRRQIMRAN